MAATTFTGSVGELRTVTGGVQVTLRDVGAAHALYGSGTFSVVVPAEDAPSLGQRVTVTIDDGDGSPTTTVTVTALSLDSPGVLVSSAAGSAYRCALADAPGLGDVVPISIS